MDEGNIRLNGTLTVIPAGLIGAEVRDADLASVTVADVEAIKSAWYRHDVLVFRGQHLNDDQLLAFSRHFGAPDAPPNQGVGIKSPPGYPDIFIVSNVIDEKGGHYPCR